MIISFTTKQLELLHVIKEGNADGSLCSVYDIIAKLPVPRARDAILHSIRILEDEGYVERESRKGVGRGRPVVLFKVTAKALEML